LAIVANFMPDGERADHRCGAPRSRTYDDWSQPLFEANRTPARLRESPLSPI
jgi:hypothetical protein